MKTRSPQRTQETAKVAGTMAVDLGAQMAAHALPDAFRAQAQPPLASELAEVFPMASGAPGVKDYGDSVALPPLPHSVLRGEQGELIENLYHITPESNAKAIMEEGLLPGMSKSSLDAVFLTQYPSTADNYQCMKDEPCVLLEIEARYIHPGKLRPDNYELQDWLDGLSDCDRIRLVGGAERWNELTGEDSLKLCAQAAYSLPIPPEAIRVVQMKDLKG